MISISSKAPLKKSPHVFAAALATETNIFSDIPTTKQDFEGMGGASADVPLNPNTSLDPIFMALQRKVESRGGNFSFGFRLFAQPAGPIDHNVYADLLEQLLLDISNAGPVDIVVLLLHGAMATTKEDDCEGDILEKVRKLVGPNVVIAVSLDPHAHLTNKMTDNADLLVFWKEYPHTDVLPSTIHALDLSLATYAEQIVPCMNVFDPHLIRLWPTQNSGVKEYVKKLRELEEREDVLSVSLVHGFPWGDNNDIGTKILVITNDSPNTGEVLAKSLGRELWDLRFKGNMDWVSIEEATTAFIKSRKRPFIFADIADNAGGGAPQDSTFILQYLLNNGIKNAAIAAIYDPESVKSCFAGGVGNSVTLEIGGKHGDVSGKPISALVNIKAIEKQVYQTSFANTPVCLGDVARVEVEGIDIYLISERSQIFSPEILLKLDATPEGYDLIIVKSLHHFYDAFVNISEDILYVSTPGCLNFDINSIPYKNLKRPVWPRALSNDFEWSNVVLSENKEGLK